VELSLYLSDEMKYNEASDKSKFAEVSKMSENKRFKKDYLQGSMKKENLLLSHDGDIALYKVDKNILDDLDELLKQFYKWKRTNCYDETLFVKFLRNKFGEKSVEFVKIVGVVGGKINQRTGEIEDDIEEEYRETRYYNF
jgi:hypothetical protein